MFRALETDFKISMIFVEVQEVVLGTSDEFQVFVLVHSVVEVSHIELCFRQGNGRSCFALI